MGSYIEEFQDSHEKKSDLVVTVDGPSGAGKGTLAEHIAEVLNIEYYSAGDFFREIAQEKGMSVEELSEKAGKEVDVEVDRRTLHKGLEEDCVIESRIASRVLGDFSDLKIFCTADLEERAERISGDLENRETEEGGKTLEEVKEKVRKRDEDNNRRYREYYDFNMNDKEVFDVIFDNTEMSVDEQDEEIDKILKQRFPDRFEENK